MFACYKLRAVPINVNYRYVDDELEYLLADADAVGIVHDAGVRERGDARRGALPRCAVRARRRRRRRSRPRSTAASARARSRAPLRRRPLRALHRRHHRHAEGRAVAPRRHLLRRDGRREPGRSADRTTRRHRGLGDRQSRRSACGRSCPPAIPGPTQFVSLALGPLMHASGQWSAIGTLLGGGKVVLYDRPHVDMEHVLDLIERERVNAMNLVGDASARPLLADARRASRTLGHVVAAPARFGRQHPLGRRQGSAAWPRSRRCSRSSRASARRSRPRRRSRSRPAPASAAPSRSLTFAAKAETIVVDDDLRPVPRGIGRRRPARHARPRAARLLQGSRAQRAHVRRDRRRALVAARRHGDRSTPTAPCTCSGADRCASTPAARRCIPKRSRRS